MLPEKTRRRFLFFVALFFLCATVLSSAKSATAATTEENAFLISNAAAGQSGRPAFVPNELLVRYQERTPASLADHVRRFGLSVVRQFHVVPVVQVRLPAGSDPLETAALLTREPGVRYAEPNYYRYPAAVPNDPFFGLQWALDNRGQTVQGGGGTVDADINAPEAWDRATSGAVVAVIDTGVHHSHSDLSVNIWFNPGEIAGNGLDDDANGFIDDSIGWDFGDNDNDPADPDGHGTAVAGIIGAAANNGTGIAGVSWSGKVMPLKFMDRAGFQTVATEIAAIQYARAMGVRVVNCSFGGEGFSRAEKDAIEATNAIFVCSAGNSGADNDVSPEYPAAYGSANILSVAASNQDDSLAYFSNFGANTVHVAAPGVNLLTTTPGGYGYFTGTSASAPVVSGIASLMFGLNGSLDATSVASLIKSSADPKPGLAGLLTTGARVNAQAALAATASPAIPAPPATPVPTDSSNRSQTERLAGTWQFIYTILSSFSQTYTLDLSTVSESSASPGQYYIFGTDTYGNNDVIAGYDPETKSFLLLDLSWIIDRFFVFDFTGNDSVSGCYYQVYPAGSANLSSCYTMNGTRTSRSGSGISPAGTNENEREQEEREASEAGEVSSLLGSGTGRRATAAGHTARQLEKLRHALKK